MQKTPSIEFFFADIPDVSKNAPNKQSNQGKKEMTGKQKKVLMAAVAVIKRYVGGNHDAMSCLEDLLLEINMEEVFDVDSIDPMADLKEKVADLYGNEKVSIAGILHVAKTEFNYPQNLVAAIFELNTGDIRRYNDNGFTPPYVLSAFSRYFKNLKEISDND